MIPLRHEQRSWSAPPNSTARASPLPSPRSCAPRSRPRPSPARTPSSPATARSPAGWAAVAPSTRSSSQALKALRDGEPRLVRLCPPEKLGTAPQEGVIEVALTCASGGTLEVYIEPHLPRPHLVAVGHLPVARGPGPAGQRAWLRGQCDRAGRDAESASPGSRRSPIAWTSPNSRSPPRPTSSWRATATTTRRGWKGRS